MVIKGTVAIAKNPCHHPAGDVRVLEGVDVPGLEHLYNCLIFLQKGDRPHTDEASGSDLELAAYGIHTAAELNLIPPSKQSWPPMEYTQLPNQECVQRVEEGAPEGYVPSNLGNKSRGLQEPGREGEKVNLSFAWIEADYLARIKIKRRVVRDRKSQKPIDKWCF
ncbi:hypothetical protein OSB04_014017 [Centaurea solstitialis]|uniref:RNA-dependent RNA polymerase n=1 Tax=Centaurea solstitialis TaxID=347529 RepID=A0AA38TZ16_9ASTR|nr:hypothetical protein OSB04_014017 [Centaurea solstitialis]